MSAMASHVARRGLAVFAGTGVVASVSKSFSRHQNKQPEEKPVIPESEHEHEGIPILIFPEPRTADEVKENVIAVTNYVASDSHDLPEPQRSTLRRLMQATAGHLSDPEVRRSIERQADYRALAADPAIHAPDVPALPDVQSAARAPERRTYVAEAGQSPNVVEAFRAMEQYPGRVQVTIEPIAPAPPVEEIADNVNAGDVAKAKDDIHKGTGFFNTTVWTVAVAMCSVVALAAASRLGSVGALVRLLKSVARTFIA